MRHYLLLDHMIVREGQIWEIAIYYLSIKVMFMHMFSITKGQQKYQFSSVQRRTSKCMHRIWTQNFSVSGTDAGADILVFQTWVA